MTLKDVFSRLHEIDQAAQALIREAGFSFDTGSVENVAFAPNGPDTRFLKESVELLLEPLSEMHSLLSYLQTPASPEYVLEEFENGRYGYRNENGSRREFSCGQTLEARIVDRCGQPRWVKTRVEHDGSDYFLIGHGSVPLAGLTIRERRQRV